MSRTQRTICHHCKGPLERSSPDAPWLDPWGGWECPKAPNPDEGPMPAHEAGGAILERPVFDNRLTTPTPVVPVYLPPSGPRSGGAA